MAQTRQGIDIDISGALKKLERVTQAMRSGAEEAVGEITKDAAVVARLALSNASTDWGSTRLAAGRGLTSGRADTGRMLNRLRALKTKSKGKNVFRGEVGWYFPNEYFKYQERGTGKYSTDPNAYDPNWNYQAAYNQVAGTRGKGGIVGAHSLWTARKWMEQNKLKYVRKILARVRQAGGR